MKGRGESLPRHYQIKKNNPYIMDRDIYMQMFYLIRCYPRLLDRREALLYGSPPPPDGQPRGSGTGNPTEQKAVILCTIDTQIEAIEQTIVYMRGKYSTPEQDFDAYEAFMDYGVFCWYRSKPSKDMAPCKKTWYRYRSEFAYHVAKKLNYF